jgi:hypothetical protein
MRQIILFIVVAMVLSLLNRRRAPGAGPPVAPPPGLDRIPKRFGETERRPESPMEPAAPPTRERAGDAMAQRMRERVERRRDELRRRAEADAARAEAERAAGPRTETPGGIDPRLLEQGRTPLPTPEPIHPR